ncbi:2-oxoglutarate dehydrogenase complex dihydrolipoyllysine-residue succinyltransferase [Cohaesibacter sp. CAU 1516]|uniref:2-oxoglutarate dehydrogenase complex dihydrolipoyllysine-residue succinyltransferase n=1 Tax=Cohaesibacter sp. CAU 1516 TaxID=2576038 RepID=UPI0010FD8999|nr:2-oxoglutarate dehydrogenase complex dihydrolipoyllysine-residue succinyltransferase [Cohaesibacter sp. CAU 1516]TLP46925.1 2-oxoglutarate dehydrogenase complex dihydrolipoyllysine-residue succinyltransferase [Cohaesibacter sp. CAU 1516]
MATEIKVPTLGESVTEATIGQWFKATGDAVQADEPLVELETDKVTIEVPAPVAGTLGDIVAPEGETVEVGALLAMLIEGSGAGAAAPAPAASAPAAAPAAPAPAPAATGTSMPPAPSAGKMMAEQKIDPASVAGSGVRGQVLKGDVINAIASGATAPSGASALAPAARPSSKAEDAVREERVRMTKLRQTIARRLKDAQNTAAMLTTFNDIDMSAVMNLRKEYKDLFEKKHGVRLGFMGFFAKAVCQALQEIPAVNAEIDGTDIIYKHFVHLGVAVGSPRGLVVPVVRDADQMSIAEMEKAIGDYGRAARDGKLTIEQMQGGTFTISNGGVYGSMMSTPILNAPQSGILGMHRIEERPVVRNGEIVIRPMMYLALSYDHRIVDGKEAVTFLVRIKEALEDPQRLVLDL